MERNVWRKSARSGNNGQCVEVRHQEDAVDVRDSKDPTGPILTFALSEWAAFIASARHGEFDQR